METKKPLEVLVIEDFGGAPHAFDGFEDELKTKMSEKGYDISLTLCKSYDEYKSLKDPTKYDTLITDIMLPGGSREIERLIRDTLQDDEKYARAMELDKKYAQYNFLSSEEKQSFYFEDLDTKKPIKVPFIQALKMGEKTLESVESIVGEYASHYASGLLIAQELKSLGKKPTLYTSRIGTSGHAMRARALLRCLEEDFLPFEDVLSVAQQEESYDSRGPLKVLLPTSGKATIMSIKGDYDKYQSLWEYGGEKRAGYADALEAAIKYQA